MVYDDTTIIIPTFNEEKNIGKLLNKLKQILPKAKIIVSDDGSRYRTQEIVVEKGAILLDRKRKPVHGLTVSVLDAIIKCKTDFFVVIDADFQHPPEKILEVVGKLRSGKDLVVGNRIKVQGDWGFMRLLISRTAFFMGYVRLILKKFPKYDLVSGFFGAKTKLVREVALNNQKKFELRGYKVLFDLLKYMPNTTKVGKVDYEFGLRTKGDSKLNWKIMFYYFRSMFK